EPLGSGADGQPVYLRDIWPSTAEIEEAIRSALEPAMFEKQYGHVFEGDDHWQGIRVPTGQIYAWDEKSTYIKKPPYFDDMVDPATSVTDLHGLRALAVRSEERRVGKECRSRW